MLNNFDIGFSFNFILYNLNEINLNYINCLTDFRSKININKLFLNSLIKNNYNSKILKNDVYVSLNLLYNYNQNNYIINSDFYDFIIYQGHHSDFFLKHSDLLIPSSFIYEQDNLFLNILGKFKESKFIFKPIIDIRDSNKIIDFFKNTLYEKFDSLFLNNYFFFKQDKVLRDFFYKNYLLKNEIYFIYFFFYNDLMNYFIFDTYSNFKLNYIINIHVIIKDKIFFKNDIFKYNNVLFIDLINNFNLTDSISRSSLLINLDFKNKYKNKNFLF